MGGGVFVDIVFCYLPQGGLLCCVDNICLSSISNAANNCPLICVCAAAPPAAVADLLFCFFSHPNPRIGDFCAQKNALFSR